MHISPIAPLLLALLGGLWQVPTPASAPVARQDCWFEPSGTVNIDPGNVQVFYSDACAGATVTISPADGTAGFSSGTDCTLTQVTNRTVLFKVRGCVEGTVTATVSSGGFPVQSIDIVVGPDQ